MTMSNEPGFYADGKYGIRIENIDVIRLAETRNNFGGKGFLELEHVTMVRQEVHFGWKILTRCPSVRFKHLSSSWNYSACLREAG
jgi:Xaa-Pro aminopeptidase